MTTERPQKPRRCYTIQVEIGADSWDEASSELERIAAHVKAHGPACRMVSGGYSSGSMVTVNHDPAMTHDRYFEALDKYLEAR